MYCIEEDEDNVIEEEEDEGVEATVNVIRKIDDIVKPKGKGKSDVVTCLARNIVKMLISVIILLMVLFGI